MQDTWNYKTWYPKHEDTLNTKKKWFIVDAQDMVLGRMASAIAVKIRGKDSRYFTPSMDMGAYVIVINAEKVGDVLRLVNCQGGKFGTVFHAG